MTYVYYARCAYAGASWIRCAWTAHRSPWPVCVPIGLVYAAGSVRGGGILLDQWVVRPQQFFPCHLRPRSARLPRMANYAYGPDDIQVQLVFYSTFEPMVLPGGGPMEAMGVQKLY